MIFSLRRATRFKTAMRVCKRMGAAALLMRQAGLGTPLIYEAASQFSEGLARVKLNGRYTYVDENGFLYFPPVFEEASDFEVAPRL